MHYIAFIYLSSILLYKQAKIAREAEVQKLIKDKLPNSTLFFNQQLGKINYHIVKYSRYEKFPILN